MHACFRGRRGFSLIEVLIATVILSVGIVTVLCAFHTSLSALGSVRDGLWAGMLIGEKMAELEGAAQDRDEGALCSGSGTFAGVYEGFSWRTEVSEVDSPGRARDDNSYALMRVDVWVWRDANKRYGASTCLWLDKREVER